MGRSIPDTVQVVSTDAGSDRSQCGVHVALQLPTDRPRPPAPAYTSAVLEIALPAELVAGARELSRRHDVTLFVTLLSSWSALLGRWSRQDDVPVGARVARASQATARTGQNFSREETALCIHLHDDMKVEQLLRHVDGALMHARACQLASAWESRPFQVLVELRTSGVRAAPRTTSLELSLSVREVDAKTVVATLEYATELFDRGSVELMLTSWQVLLGHFVQGDRRQASRLPLLSAATRDYLLRGLNDTAASTGCDRLVHMVIEEQAGRTPDAIAVECGQKTLSYGELNRRANQLARHLRRSGVGPDQFVGLYIERGLEMIVGLLGILKAGGAYIPFDVRWPVERLAYVMLDSAPCVVVTQQRLMSSLPSGHAAQVVVIDSGAEAIAGESPLDLDALDVGTCPRHAVYVIYTSGSTGEPKGVVVEHRQLANLVGWHIAAFEVGTGVRCSCVAAIGFDAATWEIWPTLAVGATLVVASAPTLADAESFLSWWAEQALDLSFLPTPMAELMFSRGMRPAGLRTLLVGGDRLNQRPAAPSFALFNAYGPTETTVAATCGRIYDDDPVLHIGRPIANVQIYVLDGHLEPVPPGVPGDIYIAGAGVARGYLHRPQLTEQRFVPDPFGTCPDARMYRSGDVGRWRVNGTIEFLGRSDDQVKIRGYRIELGEIEAQLGRHPAVKEVVVIVREDVPGAKFLVAYFTCRESIALSLADLRAHLGSVLPDYMIPAAFVTLPHLPLTSNGKVDRRALPQPHDSALVGDGYVAPQGSVEEALAAIWRKLLQVNRVSRNDNFFELGGHSLTIVHLLEELRQAGYSAVARCVFDNPTVAGLAKVLSHELPMAVPANLIPAGCEAITPQMLPLLKLEHGHIERIASVVPGGSANVQDIYPLAPLQEGILFHHLLETRSDTYVRPMLLSIASRQRLDELAAALQSVIDRHDALRTMVLWEQLPQPVQVVLRYAELTVNELLLDRQHDTVKQLLDRMHDSRQRMDLRQAPLLRLEVAASHVDGEWYALLWTHHFVCDNQSLDLLLEEVGAHMVGRAQTLPASIPYRNHVAGILARSNSSEDEKFFRGKLLDIDESTAPFGQLDVRGDASQLEEAREVLESDLTQELRARARSLSVSAATMFHAAWALVVACTSARDDVVFGTVLLGRMQSGVGAQRILGMFINTLPLRLRLCGLSAQELILLTHRELVELLDHEQASLAVAQRCSSVDSTAPLFTSLLNFTSGAAEDGFASTPGVSWIAGRTGTNYPIMLAVADHAESFTLDVKADRRIGARRMLQYMHVALTSLSSALRQAPWTSALQLQILPAQELLQVIDTFNATATSFPDQKLLHELFEEQAARTPAAIAITDERTSLTYAQLNGKANQLARHLRERGVGPDKRVAFCPERGVDVLVGLLGILKAGGAYVPLDMKNPVERLAHVLTDAQPCVVLTHASVRPSLPRVSAQTIALDADWTDIARHGKENLPSHALGLDSRHLAYVIYTSGSTGKPKGVMVEHRSIVNYAVHAARQFDVARGDGTLICTSISFDLMLTGLYPTLLCGRTVRFCVEDQGMPALPQDLLRYRDLAPLKLTPSHMALLEPALLNGELVGRVRVLVLGGEQLQAEKVNLWRRHAPGTRVFNHYGPSEATVGCVVNEVCADASGPVPIGRPISNTRIRILNSQLQPVPVEVPGEIHIGGVGVARGYLNRPELTAERFIADPMSSEADARLYRSGDVGRWRPDGTIEYLGRTDQQVKIRGYRIELGEIEALLKRHPQVADAAVIAREDLPGEKRLVAYVTPRFHPGPSVEELRGHLHAGLPDYMVPAACVLLQALPLTPNGKLDRRSLPAPGLAAFATREFEAPQGEIEETLSAIWRELLRVQRVGRQDNFFDLGGHSLLALRVTSHIGHALDVALPLSVIFEHPTIESLKHRILQEIASELSPEAT